MAATPIYGKNSSKIFFSEISTKLGMKHRGLLSIIVCSNDDTGVTLTYLTARSNLIIRLFYRKKVKTGDFSEIIEASDLKNGRCRQLIEFMTVYEY